MEPDSALHTGDLVVILGVDVCKNRVLPRRLYRSARWLASDKNVTYHMFGDLDFLCD